MARQRREGLGLEADRAGSPKTLQILLGSSPVPCLWLAASLCVAVVWAVVFIVLVTEAISPVRTTQGPRCDPKVHPHPRSRLLSRDWLEL